MQQQCSSFDCRAGGRRDGRDCGFGLASFGFGVRSLGEGLWYSCLCKFQDRVAGVSENEDPVTEGTILGPLFPDPKISESRDTHNGTSDPRGSPGDRAPPRKV